MKTRSIAVIIIMLIVSLICLAVDNQGSKPGIKEENITYKIGNTDYKGFIAYNENVKGKRPVVLVVHEWWGMNEYPRMRARQLAELGYIAMAVDMYGGGKTVSTPADAQKLASPFYTNPQLSKTRLEAAMKKIKEHKLADESHVFAIGYCFGGSVVLNAAKLGSNLEGVVSFHGALQGAPARKDLLKAKVLVCHGGNDKSVPDKDVKAFKQQMDSIKADYKLIVYPGATHAFTNPNATETGKKFNMPIEYNAKADQESWRDMRLFFSSILKP